MGALALVQLALTLLQGVLSVAVKSNLPGEIVSAVEGAIASVQNVIDTDVTYQQLEGLRTTPKW